jgi:hypothetical protein
MFKKFSNTIFHKNPSSAAELFHADGQTDRKTDIMKIMVSFCNFIRVPKKHKSSW